MAEIGGGLKFYRSSVARQRGSGLGAIFGAVAKHLIPFAKNYVLPITKKYVPPRALEALKNVGDDYMNGNVPIRTSIKKNSLDALKNVGKDIWYGQSGSGRKRKKKVQAIKKNKSKKVKLDLFSENG